ncbi:MAG: hypothetical protein HKN21_06340 [Candidatus Eisenbacteria bacterium]|uniref:Uncharacterized protein n=1 Tax=Eiseniibacteriota bacterium TaxID=2212470 RepID=A0A7Y2EAF8_UNCEI|nr:hypothetical protein [Candidatus Eisenbacteria bacterium]
MKRYLVPLLAVLFCSSARADEESAPVIVLHVNPVVGKNQCTAIDPLCNEVVTHGEVVDDSPDASYTVYMMANILQGDAIREVELGIWYIGEFDDANLTEGINVLSWTGCSDSETPSAEWPEKNSTNSMSFSSDVCQNRPASPAELTILGNFYVTAYSSSLMQTIPVPQNGTYTVTGCEEEPIPMSWPQAAGWIAFGNRSEGQGVNPCYFTPVKASTWGALKKSLR